MQYYVEASCLIISSQKRHIKKSKKGIPDLGDAPNGLSPIVAKQ